jgi:hypothetical protein
MSASGNADRSSQARVARQHSVVIASNRCVILTIGIKVSLLSNIISSIMLFVFFSVFVHGVSHAQTASSESTPKRSALLPSDFYDGKTILSYSFFGKGASGASRLKELYDLGDWVELARSVLSQGNVQDVYYLYLGRSAHELGFPAAAREYYSKALKSRADSCKLTLIYNVCQGIDVVSVAERYLSGEGQPISPETDKFNLAYYSARTSVRDDDLETVARIASEGVVVEKSIEVDLRAFIPKIRGDLSFQLIVRISYSSIGARSYVLAVGASASGPVDLNLRQIQYTPDCATGSRPGDRSCFHYETLAVDLPEQLVREIGSYYGASKKTYWNARIRSRTDHAETIQIPHAAFAAFIPVVDSTVAKVLGRR